MIYLDWNSTTPVLPEVLEAMMPYLTSEWGNPSSTYKFGSKLKTVIETARAQVAELIGAHAMEIIFTSCATESINAAIHAALKANPGKRHIITSAVEHSAVLNYCRAMEKEGCRVTHLPCSEMRLRNWMAARPRISPATSRSPSPLPRGPMPFPHYRREHAGWKKVRIRSRLGD